jgi:hypothetical protein
MKMMMMMKLIMMITMTLTNKKKVTKQEVQDYVSIGGILSR